MLRSSRVYRLLITTLLLGGVCLGRHGLALALPAAAQLQLQLQAAEALFWSGQPSQALAETRALVTQAGDDAALPLAQLGHLHDALLEFEEAWQAHTLALQNATQSFGPHNPALVPYLSALGEHWIQAGDLQQASQWFETALDVVAQALGPAHLNTQSFYNVLASLAMLREDKAAALGNATRSLEVVSLALWPEHPAHIKALGMLGTVQAHFGEVDGARQSIAAAIRLGQVQLGPTHPDVLRMQLQETGMDFPTEKSPAAEASMTENPGPATSATGPDADAAGRGQEDPAELDAAAARARDILRKALDAWGPAWPRLVIQAEASGVARALLHAGRPAEAIALQRMRLALWDAAGLAQHLGRDLDLTRLARLLLAAGHPREALEILQTLLAPTVWRRIFLVHSPAALALLHRDLDSRLALLRQLIQSPAAPGLRAEAARLLDDVTKHPFYSMPFSAVQAAQRQFKHTTPDGVEQYRLRTLAMRLQGEGPQGQPLERYADRLTRIRSRIDRRFALLPHAPDVPDVPDASPTPPPAVPPSTP